MSGKSMNFFKNKSSKKPLPPAPPRDIATIKGEYGQLASKAGELQYVIYAQKQELENINRRLMQLNNEGGERNRLDQEEAKKNAEKEPTNG